MWNYGLKIAAVVAAIILAPLVSLVYNWSTSGCRPADYEPLFILMRLHPIKVVPKKAAEPREWKLSRGGLLLEHSDSLKECTRRLPFSPVHIDPPAGFQLQTSTVYRYAAGSIPSTRLSLFYKSPSGCEMMVSQPSPFAYDMPSPGLATIKNFDDKPPVVGDPWHINVQMAVLGFPRGEGVYVWLHGPASTRPPELEQLMAMIRSATILKNEPRNSSLESSDRPSLERRMDEGQME